MPLDVEKRRRNRGIDPGRWGRAVRRVGAFAGGQEKEGSGEAQASEHAHSKATIVLLGLW